MFFSTCQRRKYGPHLQLTSCWQLDRWAVLLPHYIQTLQSLARTDWQNTTCLDTYGLSNPDLLPTQTQIWTHSPLCVPYFHSSFIVLLIWHTNIFLLIEFIKRFHNIFNDIDIILGFVGTCSTGLYRETNTKSNLVLPFWSPMNKNLT